MTPEQLKGSLLFAALQGKIVEQNENELVPDLSGIKNKKTEEIEFDIPSKWQTAHLESISVSIASKQYQIAASEFKTEGSFPVVSQSKEYVIGYCNDKTKLYHHDKPVVVFGDHTTIVKYVDFDFVVGADGVKIFEPNTDIITAKFFSYVLDYYSTGLEKVGGYSRHYKFVKDKPFPIPPVEEQHRIVAKIEELLPYVDRYAEAYEKLEQFNAKFPEDMKKSILQFAIQGKLVEQRPEEGTAEELYQQIQDEKQKLIKEGKIKKEKPFAEVTGDEIPFDIPENWKWVRLGDIYWYIDAGKSPNCAKTSVTGEQWGVITTTAIQTGFFDDEQNKILPENFDVKTSMQIHAGDILITRAGPMNRTGIACKVDDIRYNLILSDKTLRINMTDEFICKDYVVMILNSPQIRSLLIERMSGMDKQQVNISQDKYKTVLLPLPPLKEQERVVAKVKQLLPYCDQLIK